MRFGVSHDGEVSMVSQADFERACLAIGKTKTNSILGSKGGPAMMEKHELKLGEVAVPLDKTSVIKTFDALDKLTPADWKKAAEHLGLPVDPFDKRLLKPVLMGAVQSGWYLMVEGKVPAKCASNQEARVERYKQQHAEAKENDGKDLVAGKPKKAAVPGKERVANLYRLVEKAKAEWSKFSGQKFIIVKTLQLLGAGPGGKGVTVRAVFEGQKEYDGIVKPSDKNCAFHFNKFSHEGIVEQVNEAGLVIGEDKNAAKPAAPKPAAKGGTTPKKGK